MKKVAWAILILTVCATTVTGAEQEIIPRPEEMTVGSGDPFLLNAESKIVCPDALRPEAGMLRKFCGPATGFALPPPCLRRDMLSPHSIAGSEGQASGDFGLRLKVKRFSVPLSRRWILGRWRRMAVRPRRESTMGRRTRRSI